MAGEKVRFTVSHDQRWYELGTILSGAFTFPMIIIGQHLAIQYGVGTAIFSILVANLILWLIGLAIISMALEDRSNAIENVKSYLGNFGATLMWLILLFSILNWFVTQLNAVVPLLGFFLKIDEHWQLTILGTTIALLTTLLSMGGIRMIKRMIVWSFPLIFAYYVISIVQSDVSIREVHHFGLSVSAILSTIFVILPGTLNLPTLFRHARSKPDSYLGLAIMTLLFSFFEISTIWIQFPTDGAHAYTASLFTSFTTFAFLLLTLIYINLINIYYISACWESYVPWLQGKKGYVITGLLGIASYLFIQHWLPTSFVANLTNCYLGSLGIVLLIAYFIRIVVRHRPRKFEMTINMSCWFLGCIASTIYTLHNQESVAYPTLVGAMISASAFICLLFIEESLWAVKETLFRYK